MNLRRLLPLVLAVGLVSVPPSHARSASCDVAGLVSTHTQWEFSECPVINVVGSVIVESGAILAIAPGITVKFAPMTSLTVQGMLYAVGTPTQWITFTSASATPARGDWGGIKFDHMSVDAWMEPNIGFLDGSTLQYAIVEYGGGGGQTVPAVWANEASPYLNHNIVRHNRNNGIYVRDWDSTGFYITNNEVFDNGTEDLSALRINSSNGIHVEGRAIISGNDVHDNHVYGIFVDVTSKSLQILNNTAARNGETGIRLDSIGNALIYGNLLTNNGSSGLEVMTFQNSTLDVAYNRAENNQGCGIRLSGMDVARVWFNTAIGNSSVGDNIDEAGGLCVSGATRGIVTGNDLSSNSGTTGGGLSIKSTTDLVLTNNMLTHNSADQGGGFYVVGSNVRFSGGTVTNNTASQPNGGGGFAYYSGGSLTVTGNNIFNNLAGTPSVANDAAALGSSGALAEGNWWGTSSVATIEVHIWHAVDQAGRGVIDYSPAWTAGPFTFSINRLLIPSLRK